jgi:NADPH:quinone reductase-like Zn-dependent oxidoreductase
VSHVDSQLDDGRQVMRAIRLHAPGGPAELSLDEIEVPPPGQGEVLVRVHAAAITRDELEWPLDRLPAIPSYEVSGTAAVVGSDVADFAVGDAVFGLTGFDRDGAAAEYVAVAAGRLARKPRALSHVESAAVPLPALSAWQGLFEQGGLREGERVAITGAAGGVGQFATQLARLHGAHVIGTASSRNVELAAKLGAHEVVDHSETRFAEALEPVDLVFDTVGGDVLARSATALRDGGRLVSVAEEPPARLHERLSVHYFVVEPNREQLAELARLTDDGLLRPEIDSLFSLADAREAFARSMVPGTRGKVVLRVIDD